MGRSIHPAQTVSCGFAVLGFVFVRTTRQIFTEIVKTKFKLDTDT